MQGDHFKYEDGQYIKHTGLIKGGAGRGLLMTFYRYS